MRASVVRQRQSEGVRVISPDWAGPPVAAGRCAGLYAANEDPQLACRKAPRRGPEGGQQLG